MGKRALVVDEVLENRISFGRFFQWMGFDVVQAINGAEAIKLFEEDPFFDVVVVGNVLTGVDGSTVTKLIRQYQVAKRPYIVGIGTNADNSERAIRSGMDGYIVRPGAATGASTPVTSGQTKNVVPLFGRN